MSASIKVEVCPQCGASVQLDARQCRYCESEFIVASLGYLDKFDKPAVNKYISHYKQLLKGDPDNGELNLAMGICYLDLGLFDLSAKYCSTALEQIPENGDAYYYCAIAMLKGRKPKIVTLTEVRKIEQLLSAAIQLDNSKAKYFYMLAMVKHDFYVKNCMRQNPPSVEELMQQAQALPMDEQEMDKLLQRVPVELT